MFPFIFIITLYIWLSYCLGIATILLQPFNDEATHLSDFASFLDKRAGQLSRLLFQLATLLEAPERMNQRDLYLAYLSVDEIFYIFRQYRNFFLVLALNWNLSLKQCIAISIILKDIAIQLMIENQFQSVRRIS